MSKNKNTNENHTTLSLTAPLRDVVDSVQSLQEITGNKVTATLAFTLGIVLRTIDPFLTEYNKQRNALIEKHYNKTEKGKPPEPKTETSETEFRKEIGELLDASITLIGIGRIKVSTLEGEGIKLDGQDVAALYWLLKNDTEPLFETE